MSKTDPEPSDIVPDDVDAEELRRRVQASIPDGGNRRCPECGRRGLRPTSGGYNVEVDHDFCCQYNDCRATFDRQEVDC